MKDKLNADIKTALLAGDKTRAEVLKSLKSAIQYEEVAMKMRDSGLSDEQVLTVYTREAKKRAESAEMYQQGGYTERAAAELAEKAIIEEYLPKQLSDEELEATVSETIKQLGGAAQIGSVIGQVRAKVGSTADGARIAALVKQKLG